MAPLLTVAILQQSCDHFYDERRRAFKLINSWGKAGRMAGLNGSIELGSRFSKSHPVFGPRAADVGGNVGTVDEEVSGSAVHVQENGFVRAAVGIDVGAAMIAGAVP
jgi:hypothetical protein